MLQRWNKALQNIAILIVAFLVMLFGFEILLRLGLFHDVEDPKPVWIPRKYKLIEQKINAQNLLIAQKHPYSFNDSVRAIQKKKGSRRIAVLGDSFIWGDAVAYERIWSHKLERILQKKIPSVELMSWGGNGWSTQRQLRFLKEEGYKFHPDMLLIGFVANDPDVGLVPRFSFTWQKMIWLKPAEWFVPNALDFLSSGINNLLMKYGYKGYGYVVWEHRLYEEKNLRAYREVLVELRDFCKEQEIELRFIMTPSNNAPYYKEVFGKVTPLLKELEIPYLNLVSKVESEFKGRTSRSLWATPANAHPGDELTTVFAEGAFSYLEDYLNKELQDSF